MIILFGPRVEDWEVYWHLGEKLFFYSLCPLFVIQFTNSGLLAPRLVCLYMDDDSALARMVEVAAQCPSELRLM